MTAWHWVLLVMAAVAGLAGGWFVQQWLAAEEASVAEQVPEGAQAIVGERRPDFTMTDPDGDRISIDRFDGDILVINFWATWCPPCVDEVPMLIELHDDLADDGVRVIGVAVEEAGPVREFADDFAINYPLMIGERDGFEVVEDYGNPRGTLPYTVFVDRDGIVRGTHNGLLTREQAEQHLQSLLDG